MITIDGSAGEGGGQILRSALALSLVTGKPFAIHAIRAGRRKPGLMRQHLTAVSAAARIGNAGVEGHRIGSDTVVFRPGGVQPGAYRFSVGSAGSCTLVLQAVLPALMTAPAPSEVVLEGGTHNPYAPPFDFLARAYLPLVGQMGPRVTAVLEKPGFYPAGGGRFRVTVQPAARLTPLELTARGDVIRQTARAAVSNLPEKIARRELAVVARQTGWAPEALTAEVVGNAHGPGNILTLAVESRHVTEVFTGFGERGVSAEKVAAGAVRRLREYLAAEVPVGRYLADQLLLPMAMSGAGRFLTLAPSRHTTTNIDIIRRFLDVEITLSQPRHDQWMVEIQTPNHRRKEPCHGVDKKNG